MRMDTYEAILSMIQVIRTLTQVEIKDADRINLLHLLIPIPYLDMLRNRLSHPIQDALQEVQLTHVLHLDDDDLPLVVFRLDIHTVKLIIAP